MTKEAKEFLDTIDSSFKAIANPVRAKQMQDYLKNRFQCLGITSPQRKELVRPFKVHFKTLTTAEQNKIGNVLFEHQYREFHYVALELFEPLIKKMEVEALPYFNRWIGTNSWWDTVDWIAPKFLGGLLLKYPEHTASYNKQWIESDDFWYQRTAILFQLKYKEKMDVDLVFQNILARRDSKEFFVRKAAGWILRELSKRDPKVVRTFLDAHELNPLTVREGSKYL